MSAAALHVRLKAISSGCESLVELFVLASDTERSSQLVQSVGLNRLEYKCFMSYRFELCGYLFFPQHNPDRVCSLDAAGEFLLLLS